jgi:GNAT superfamily N-acetyltransferase
MENKRIKLIDLLEETINWDRASEFYDTGNYVTINKNYGIIEFGLETLSDGEEALFINDISIKPEFQGKGYGSKIIQSAIEYAKEQGIPVALRASVGGHYDTNSNMSQEDLIKFYKKFGFENRPDLSNFGHDDIFMVKF